MTRLTKSNLANFAGCIAASSTVPLDCDSGGVWSSTDQTLGGLSPALCAKVSLGKILNDQISTDVVSSGGNLHDWLKQSLVVTNG